MRVGKVRWIFWVADEEGAWVAPASRSGCKVGSSHLSTEHAIRHDLHRTVLPLLNFDRSAHS